MHGVQPKAKAMPMTGGAHDPEPRRPGMEAALAQEQARRPHAGQPHPEDDDERPRRR